MVRSDDSGQTFAPRERVTETSSDTRIAPFAGGFSLDDYMGLTSQGQSFFPFFTQTTGSRRNRTDEYSAEVFGPAAAAEERAEPVVTCLDRAKSIRPTSR
ncbi:MAG: hypothetical protein ACRD0W_01590 [Acidimicrobiales bacterium]